MATAILLLSDLSYSLGIIGLAELAERNEIAAWLSDPNDSQSDPRGALGEQENAARGYELDEHPKEVGATDASGSAKAHKEPPWLSFLAFNRWHFTLGDADCVPSVPHGHEHAKTQKWPKLNPYTGRAYISMNNEDVSKRLTRNEMQQLWRNDDFVEHCRKQVIWYANEYPSYKFAHARRGMLRFPQW